MSPGKILKVALRSRSLAFARAYAQATGAPPADAAPAAYDWRAGDGAPVWYRPGTSDLGLIYDVMLKPGAKGEYWLPPALAPRMILDIGANIGVASRYLAHWFPEARVHAFEPVPANLALAGKNVAASRRIALHGFGLGAESGEVAFASPDPGGYNQGGYSQFAGAARGAVSAPVRRVAEALAALGIDRVDVIKIDTEGAEYPILAAFPEEVLARASWVYGELHSEALAEPAGFKVLEHLSRWFDIETYKPVRKKNWFFDACRRDLGAALRGFRRYR